MKSIAKGCAVIAAASCAAAMMAGCNDKAPTVTEAEKKNWAGSAPPPGFDKEIEKQNREWKERNDKAKAQSGGEAVKAPPGVKVP